MDAYVVGKVGSVHGCTPHSTHVHSLFDYYTMRASATCLQYWELIILLILPLALVGAVVDNIHTLLGRRAPLRRHVIDIIALVALVAAVGVAVKAKMTVDEFLAYMKDNGEASSKTTSSAGDAKLYLFMLDMSNLHFLLFLLNVFQFFIPIMRWNIQKEQDKIKFEQQESTPLAGASKEKEDAAAVLSSSTKKQSAPALPTAEDVRAHAEAVAEAEANEGLRKRK